ncbi:MAG: cytochrome b N-terminal domain-containing protein [Deltaproteobacteria bacterium]|nr:cytochrome b N-terminal domain-containing protein [Deltaproteobacteria bacterium]MBW2326424.1 cytochrome b N-terminal domain-containing protein [Deltaproteobacteria bacterium]
MTQHEVAPKKLSVFQRIRYSVFPGTQRPVKDQRGYRRFFNSLILHFRPRTVPDRTLRLTLSWGLGGMAVVLIFLLIGTGVLLKFVYEPFPDKAYDSILHLQRDVLFGQLIRNIHHWSANLILIVVFLHFLRVYFTGAFHPPRQFNWVIGLGLFFTVLLSNFTGYLLPWDQLAFWAVTICAGMLEYIPGVGLWLQKLIQGGPAVGSATLSNFYAIHTAILPALVITLMPLHFWRVRKAGGLVIPGAPGEIKGTRGESVPAIPNLILREVVVALVLLACILVFSVLFNAPLESKANPGLSPNPTKAPWYFLGIQEMLMHFHPFFSLFLIPILMMTALLGLPYIDYNTDTGGVWFASPTGRKTAVVAALTATVATPVGILADEHFIDLANWADHIPPLITNGLIPFVIIFAASAGFYVLIKRKYSATNNEAIQALFVLFLVAFLILTATGMWFRGPGMKLMLPFY